MSLKQRHSALYASRSLISIFELCRQVNVMYMYMTYIDVIIRNVAILAQHVDLGLTWTQISEGTFSHGTAQLISYSLMFW